MSLVGKKAPLFNVPAVIDGEEIVENFSLEQYLGSTQKISLLFALLKFLLSKRSWKSSRKEELQ